MSIVRWHGQLPADNSPADDSSRGSRGSAELDRLRGLLGTVKASQARKAVRELLAGGGYVTRHAPDGAEVKAELRTRGVSPFMS